MLAPPTTSTPAAPPPRRKSRQRFEHVPMVYELHDLINGIPANLTVQEAIGLHVRACGVRQREGVSKRSLLWRTICGHALLSVTLARTPEIADQRRMLRYLERTEVLDWPVRKGIKTASMRAAYIDTIRRGIKQRRELEKRDRALDRGAQ